jgi:hypothetical protein
VASSPSPVVDPASLPAVELGFLVGGPDLATVVACTDLYVRGIVVDLSDADWQRTSDNAVGLPDDPDVAAALVAYAGDSPLALAGDAVVDGHPLARAAAARIVAGDDVPTMFERLRAGPEMADVREHLVAVGLLAGGSRRRARSRSRRTDAGRTIVGLAVESAPPANATWPRDAGPRRVAALGPGALRSVAPALARALGLLRRVPDRRPGWREIVTRGARLGADRRLGRGSRGAMDTPISGGDWGHGGYGT